jgi:hypothetical protein
MAQNKIAGIRWVNKRELRKVLNEKSRRLLGVSGAEFQRKFSSGKLGQKELDKTSGTIELATLCSFTGGKSAGTKRKRG